MGPYDGDGPVNLTLPRVASEFILLILPEAKVEIGTPPAMADTDNRVIILPLATATVFYEAGGRHQLVLRGDSLLTQQYKDLLIDELFQLIFPADGPVAEFKPGLYRITAEQGADQRFCIIDRLVDFKPGGRASLSTVDQFRSTLSQPELLETLLSGNVEREEYLAALRTLQQLSGRGQFHSAVHVELTQFAAGQTAGDAVVEQVPVLSGEGRYHIGDTEAGTLHVTGHSLLETLTSISQFPFMRSFVATNFGSGGREASVQGGDLHGPLWQAQRTVLNRLFSIITASNPGESQALRSLLDGVDQFMRVSEVPNTHTYHLTLQLVGELLNISSVDRRSLALQIRRLGDNLEGSQRSYDRHGLHEHLLTMYTIQLEAGTLDAEQLIQMPVLHHIASHLHLPHSIPLYGDESLAGAMIVHGQKGEKLFLELLARIVVKATNRAELRPLVSDLLMETWWTDPVAGTGENGRPIERNEDAKRLHMLFDQICEEVGLDTSELGKQRVIDEVAQLNASIRQWVPRTNPNSDQLAEVSRLADVLFWMRQNRQTFADSRRLIHEGLETMATVFGEPTYEEACRTVLGGEFDYLNSGEAIAMNVEAVEIQSLLLRIFLVASDPTVDRRLVDRLHVAVERFAKGLNVHAGTLFFLNPGAEQIAQGRAGIPLTETLIAADQSLRAGRPGAKPFTARPKMPATERYSKVVDADELGLAIFVDAFARRDADMFRYAVQHYFMPMNFLEDWEEVQKKVEAFAKTALPAEHGLISTLIADDFFELVQEHRVHFHPLLIAYVAGPEEDLGRGGLSPFRKYAREIDISSRTGAILVGLTSPEDEAGRHSLSMGRKLVRSVWSAGGDVAKKLLAPLRAKRMEGLSLLEKENRRILEKRLRTILKFLKAAQSLRPMPSSLALFDYDLRTMVIDLMKSDRQLIEDLMLSELTERLNIFPTGADRLQTPRDTERRNLEARLSPISKALTRLSGGRSLRDLKLRGSPLELRIQQRAHKLIERQGQPLAKALEDLARFNVEGAKQAVEHLNSLRITEMVSRRGFAVVPR